MSFETTARIHANRSHPIGVKTTVSVEVSDEHVGATQDMRSMIVAAADRATQDIVHRLQHPPTRYRCGHVGPDDANFCGQCGRGVHQPLRAL